MSDWAFAAHFHSFIFCICSQFALGAHLISSSFLMETRLARSANILTVLLLFLIARWTLCKTNGFIRLVEILHITAWSAAGFGIIRLMACQALGITLHNTLVTTSNEISTAVHFLRATSDHPYIVHCNFVFARTERVERNLVKRKNSEIGTRERELFSA